MKKRLLPFILALCIVWSLFSETVLAAETFRELQENFTLEIADNLANTDAVPSAPAGDADFAEPFPAVNTGVPAKEEAVLPPETESTQEETARNEPAETLTCAMQPDGIFQNGAFTGPQTIPGQPQLFQENSREDQLYRCFLNGMLARTQERINIQDLGFTTSKTDMDAINQVFKTVINDHPEVFYVSMYQYWYSNTGLVTGIKLTYYDFAAYGYSSFQQAYDAFNEGVQRALAVVESNMSELETALALHDYLVQNCIYNWDIATGQNPSTGHNPCLTTAFGALVTGDAVCQSYALAYKLLLDHFGIDSVLIGSNVMNHMWNGVYLDGDWYQVDVTWDDPVPDSKGYGQYKYFLVSDKTLGIDHKNWDEIVSCENNQYESGWIFSGGSHPICRRNGCYYYAQDNGNYLIRIAQNPSLLSETGRVVCENTGGLYSENILWHDGCVYLIAADSSNLQDWRLMRYNLDNGVISETGRFQFERTASPDGYYQALYDRIGLSYVEDAISKSKNGTIEISSGNRREVLARLNIPPEISAWEAYKTDWDGSAGIAGLTVDSDTLTAGILWGENAPWEPLTFAAAFYQRGRLVATRLCTASSGYDWPTPDLKVVRLDVRNLPLYDEIHLIMFTDEGLRPVCRAWRDTVSKP